MRKYYQNWKCFIQLAYCLRDSDEDLEYDERLEKSELFEAPNIGRFLELDEEYLEHQSLRLLDGLNPQSPEGERLILECAIDTGNIAVVESVLNRGVDVNRADELGRTALHLATLAKFNKPTIYSFAEYCRTRDFDHGAEKETNDMLFKTRNRIGVLETLLTRGADVNAVDNYGWAAVHLAALSFNKNVLEILLRHGANVRLKSAANQTLLHCACVQEYEDYVVFQILKRYITGAVLADGDVSSSLSPPIDVNGQDDLGNSALHYCASLRRPNGSYMVKELIECGADVRLKNKNGDTALQLAFRALGIENIDDDQHDDTIQKIYLLVREEIKHDSVESDGLSNFFKNSHVPSSVENHFENNSIHFAPESDNERMADAMIKYSAELNVKDKHGRTMLHVAAQEKDVDMVKLLLYGGVSLALRDSTLMHDNIIEFCNFVNAQSNEGLASVTIAAKEGYHDILSLFSITASIIDEYRFQEPYDNEGDSSSKTCKSKIDFDILDRDGCSPLYLAVKNHHYDVVKLLLNHGSNLNTQSNFMGYAALHFALSEGSQNSQSDNYNTVELLLSNGADVNLKTADELGFAPFHMIVLNILESIEVISYSNNDHRSDFSVVLGKVVETLRHITACTGQASFNKDIVGLLIKYGADINVQAKNGETAFHVVLNLHFSFKSLYRLQRDAYFAYKRYTLREDYVLSNEEKNALCYFGFDNGSGSLEEPDVLARSNTPSIVGSTLEENLMCDILKLLLVEGADLYNKKDKNGLSAVQLALSKEFLNIFRLMTRDRVDVNLSDDEGRTILMLVVSYHYANLVREELDAGADLSKKDKKGLTALHYARSGSIVDLLLSNGAEVNVQSDDGSTPLHCALRDVQECDLDCLDALIVVSSLDIKDNEGKTARDYCFELRNDTRIRSLLMLYKENGIMQHMRDTFPACPLWEYDENYNSPKFNIFWQGQCLSYTPHNYKILGLKTLYFQGFCLYTIFNYSLADLSFTRNSNLSSFLQSYEFEQHFLQSKFFIMRRFFQAKQISEMLDELSEWFSQSISSSLDLNVPEEVCRMILERITPPDLINLRHSFQQSRT